MQPTTASSTLLSVESRQAYCAGYRELSGPGFDPVDRISIRGLGETATSKNPHFLAILEERVVSYLA